MHPMNMKFSHTRIISLGYSREELFTHKDLRGERYNIQAELMQPFVLPREFNHVISLFQNNPQSANANTASKKIISVVARLQTQHRDAFLVILGDFRVMLDSTLAAFQQMVDCHTKKNKKQDRLTYCT